MINSSYRLDEDNEPLLINMSSSEVDPFYTVRDTVNSQVERCKIKNTKLQELAKSSDKSTASEFRDLKKGLTKDLKNAEKDLKGLKNAVEMIEKRRDKFPQVNNNELSSRKTFVNDSLETLNMVKAGLDSIPVRTRLEELEKSSSLGGSKSMEMSTNPMQKDNSSFIQSQQKQTQQLVQQQDASIDTLSDAVGRLHVIGTQIQEEVKEQADLLEKTDQEMDYASDKMAGVQAQLGRLLQSKDSCQIWTIVFLTFTLVILIACVIWA